MSPKKRIYELAKEYGMSGQALAAKLRDLGFSKIKSHMAALDDSDLRQELPRPAFVKRVELPPKPVVVERYTLV